MNFTNPIQICSNKGNNSFSYEKRKLLGSECIIHVPSLILGTLNDIKIGNQIVFEEIDSKGNLSSHIGLQNFVQISKFNKNIFIIDNHNHALFFWLQYYSQRKIITPISLIHIDQHTDMNDNENVIPIDPDLNQIFDFVNYDCNVGNFIQPAIQSGIISDVEQVNTEYKMINFDTSNLHSDFILDIDIDFRHPDMKIEQYSKTIQQTRSLIQQAKLVTIATSPYFIDQTLAIQIVKELLI